MNESEIKAVENTENRWYYCPKCKIFPDRIREVYDWLIERREWDSKSESYELFDGEDGDCRVECDECLTTCEERN